MESALNIAAHSSKEIFDSIKREDKNRNEYTSTLNELQKEIDKLTIELETANIFAHTLTEEALVISLKHDASILILQKEISLTKHEMINITEKSSEECKQLQVQDAFLIMV